MTEWRAERGAIHIVIALLVLAFVVGLYYLDQSVQQGKTQHIEMNDIQQRLDQIETRLKRVEGRVGL